MATFITLISVALLAAMVTSSRGDLQESSQATDIEALELHATKGTYVCGDRICKLKPGKDANCPDGLCQYPMLPPDRLI